MHKCVYFTEKGGLITPCVPSFLDCSDFANGQISGFPRDSSQNCNTSRLKFGSWYFYGFHNVELCFDILVTLWEGNDALLCLFPRERKFSLVTATALIAAKTTKIAITTEILITNIYF